MRIGLSLLLATILLVLVSCSAQQADQPKTGEFRPTATIKDLMDSVVDPNADFIWDSVATTVSVRGVEEKAPKTNEEWAEVRRHVISLMEATNLLLIPERHVAKPGEKADEPKVELQPEQIEAAINMDRATWTQRAHTLHDSVMATLKAVDAKDKEALLNSGDAIDQACEGCHLKYWYPGDEQAKKAFDERQKQK